jgi:hypothetical protein
MKASRWLASALLLTLAAKPVLGQDVVNDRSYRWYWGAQAGGILYQTNVQTLYADPIIGVHWLITGKRTALYIGGEQAFFLATATAQAPDKNSSTGVRDVTFSQVRRLFIGILAFPTQKRIEPFAGGGFAIVNIQNPVVDCSGTTANSQCATPADQFAAQSAAEDAASRAFGWIAAGFQINMGKMAIFGQYMLTSAAPNFLLSGTTHTVQGGIRYALAPAREEVGTQH